MEVSVSRMPIAEGLAPHLQRLAAQRLRGGEVALGLSSMPRLLMEVSVSGCRLPRVSRRTFSASRYSGSAAARSPLACSSGRGC